MSSTSSKCGAMEKQLHHTTLHLSQVSVGVHNCVNGRIQAAQPLYIDTGEKYASSDGRRRRHGCLKRVVAKGENIRAEEAERQRLWPAASTCRLLPPPAQRGHPGQLHATQWREAEQMQLMQVYLQ